MSDNILLSKEIDLSKLSYSKPEKNDHGGKGVYKNYDGKRLYFQAPKMCDLFGLNEYIEEGTGKITLSKQYVLDRSVKSIDTFAAKMEEMDKRNIQWGYENRNTLFGEDMGALFDDDPVRFAKMFYKPIVKANVDKKDKTKVYNSTIKVKVYRDKEEPHYISHQLFDKNGELIAPEKVEDILKTKRNSYIPVFLDSGLWVTEKTYGNSFRLIQEQVFESQGITGFVIKKDDEDDLPDNSELENVE